MNIRDCIPKRPRTRSKLEKDGLPSAAEIRALQDKTATKVRPLSRPAGYYPHAWGAMHGAGVTKDRIV